MNTSGNILVKTINTSSTSSTINTRNTRITSNTCNKTKTSKLSKTEEPGKTSENRTIIKTGNYRFTVVLFFLFTLLSCDPETTQFDGSLPEDPVNLTEFNSEHDDYNSAAPSLGRLIPFCFSTNRGSNGENYDVIYQPMNINFNKTSGVLKVINEYDNWGIFMEEFEIIKNSLDKINTAGNELGPYLLYNQNSNLSEYELLLLYSTDSGGSFDINFTFNLDRSDFSDPLPVEFLNSEFNDMYPVINSDFSRMYFCSDREGEKFDIFYVELDDSPNDLPGMLSGGSSKEVYRDTVFSSQYDDKCPFIYGSIMVFASNRPGGFGGYDLYFSKRGNGQWSAPVNFGGKINTPHDEYRPVLIDEHVDNSRFMMVFSSDRPGGKGGFDLYFAGIEK